MQHNFSGAFSWQINTETECCIFCITIEILFKVAENLKFTRKSLSLQFGCTFLSCEVVSCVLGSYGSDKDSIITCEKSRRNVCSDHSLKLNKVHRTDSKENRSKRLESVVWKISFFRVAISFGWIIPVRHTASVCCLHEYNLRKI